MAVEGGKLPLLEYQDKKQNPELWKNEAIQAGLTHEEVELIHHLFHEENHMCVTQEALMASLRDERLSGFTFLESDKARKIVAKKKMKDIGKLHSKFIEQGIERNNRKEFLDYIWNHFYQVQMG